MSEHNELGQAGEQMAVDFLLEKEYTICHRNYRYLQAEIDIIARKGDMLAIVEVKSRTSNLLGNIADAVTRKKINLLVKAADRYVTERAIEAEVRFDIITIFKTGTSLQIEHLEDAFYHF